MKPLRNLINRIKIQQKLIMLLLMIGLLPTIIVSVVAYISISKQLTTETVNQLGSIAVKQAQKINATLQADQEDALKLADQYNLQLAISNYLASPSKNTSEITGILAAKVASESSNIGQIALTDQNNTIYADTAPAQVGQKLVVTDAAKAGLENAINVKFDPIDGVNKIYISTNTNVNGHSVGTLTLIYDTDDLVATVQDYTGLGSTGDTLVAEQNSKGQAIALFPLRFNTNAALNVNLNSMHLFDHLNSTYQGVSNYRHHKVVVSVQPVVYANWVAATEIDVSEAFGPISQLRTVLLIIVIVSSVLMVLVALYFGRFFTKPILTLTQKTRAIIQGDYSQRIAVTSADEIGTLTQAFNEMTQGLQTSTRNLGEEHARLQSSLNSLNLGFLMTTSDGQVFMCNPAMIQILNLQLSKAINQEGRTTVSLDDVQKQLPNFDLQAAIRTCLNTGSPFTAHEINVGSKFMSIIGAPIRLNGKEIIGCVVVVEDVTEAKILARSKDEFFSIASHELRTPLTAIKGNTSMILDFYKDILKDPNLHEMLTDIHDSSVRLIDIVNDFLDVSRIEQGKIVFKNEAIQMEKIIESVVYEMRPVLKEKHLDLKFDRMTLKSLPPVWADADRVKQVVYNLVGNAAKFTEKGGISVTSDHTAMMVKISVSDTGRGIPLDKQQLLFHKFQQAGSSLLTRDTTRGTGLGLYISRMLVERMGGTVRLEKSEVGKGTTFSFTLPIATEAQQRTPQVPEARTME